MSRSKRKNPIMGIACSDSEKKDKQIYNRSFRRKTRDALTPGAIPDDLEDLDIVSDIGEVSDPWMMSKDGKQYLGRDIDRNRETVDGGTMGEVFDKCLRK